jgi:hypothetical protein
MPISLGMISRHTWPPSGQQATTRAASSPGHIESPESEVVLQPPLETESSKTALAASNAASVSSSKRSEKANWICPSNHAALHATAVTSYKVQVGWLLGNLGRVI